MVEAETAGAAPLLDHSLTGLGAGDGRIGDLEREIEEWVDRHGDAVVRYLTLQTGDRELAQDLAQETFARLYEFRAAHPERTLAVSWLYTVARRLAIDHWRAARARPQTALWDASLGADDPAEEAVAIREQVASILTRMPRGERQCLVLFYIEDWPLDRIARELGLSPVGVRVRLHRARGRFRGLWNDEEREEGTGRGPRS